MSLRSLKKKIGILLFNQRKPLKYILFDKIYSIFILNKTKLPKFLCEYNINGFVKIMPNFKDDLNDLINNLSIEENQKEYPPFYFKIDNEIKKKLSKVLEIINKDYITFFKEYFNSEIFPAYINLRRNINYEKINLKKELFSDNYHNDAYLFTHFKLFINLNDISEKNGPMKIISKKNTRNFIKYINYKDRQDYSDENENFSFSNTGKIGECLFFDPTKCLHKAGMPENGYKRDYLIITYIGIPKNEELMKKLIKTDIYKYENNELTSLAKPTQLIQTLKLLLNFYKKKLN